MSCVTSPGIHTTCPADKPQQSYTQLTQSSASKPGPTTPRDPPRPAIISPKARRQRETELIPTYLHDLWSKGQQPPLTHLSISAAQVKTHQHTTRETRTPHCVDTVHPSLKEGERERDLQLSVCVLRACVRVSAIRAICSVEESSPIVQWGEGGGSRSVDSTQLLDEKGLISSIVQCRCRTTRGRQRWLGICCI